VLMRTNMRKPPPVKLHSDVVPQLQGILTPEQPTGGRLRTGGPPHKLL
jgi:hypothetical protein